MITTNVSKEDSILNGMMCYLRRVEFRNGTASTLFLSFPNDEAIGSFRRRHYQLKFPDEVSQKWVPLKRVPQNFFIPKTKGSKSSISVERCQFPIEFCAATTICKYQGKTAKSLEIDLSGYAFKGGAYTALSRCETKEGNRLVSDISEKNVMQSPDVVGEMSSLRSERKLRCQLVYPNPSRTYLNLIHHNVQSLCSHFPIIKSSAIYKRADVIFLCESWLNCFDNSSQLEISGFVMHRFDYPCGSHRAHAGSVLYVRETLPIENVDSNFFGPQRSTQFVQLNTGSL